MKRNDFIVKWLAALESGEYKQTRNVLRKGRKKPSYCCLGVACEVSNQVGYVKVDIESQQQDGSEDLPDNLAKRLNMTENGHFIEPVTYKGTAYYSLVQLNDNAKARFSTIARIIREQLAAKNFQKYGGQ